MEKKQVLSARKKEEYIEILSEFLYSRDEEILRVSANEIAFPYCDEAGNEGFIVVKVSIPVGSRDGDPYDGYGAAEGYRLKLKEKEEKKAEAAKKKAAKIERDKKMREAKAAQKRAVKEKGE